MNLRDSLVLIGAFIILAIVIDSFRRAYIQRKKETELHFGKEQFENLSTNEFNNELPNGGARAANVKKNHNKNTNNQIKAHCINKKSAINEPNKNEPNLSSDYLPKIKDIHTVSSDNINTNKPIVATPHTVNLKPNNHTNQKTKAEDDQNKNNYSMYIDDYTDESLINTPMLASQQNSQTYKYQKPKASNIPTQLISKNNTNLPNLPGNMYDKSKTNIGNNLYNNKQKITYKELIVINILSKNQQFFNCSKLSEYIMALGMRFGDHSIFHYYSHENGTGDIQFSLANGEKPGTFNFAQLAQTKTRALCFFMRLPNPAESLKVFNRLELASKKLAYYLDGDLRDEHINPMTTQTFDHYRQRIYEFERKYLVSKQTNLEY